MQRICVAAVLCSLLLAACGKTETSPGPTQPQASASAEGSPALPATMEGSFVVDHANDWGSWGTLTASGTEYDVAIPASIYEASGLPEDGGEVRATLASKQTESGITIYQVSALEKR